MEWGIGFGAERLGLWALRWPRLAGFALFGLSVVICLSLPKVAFDDDIHRVFLSDSPLSQAQREYENQQSPPVSTVLIHVTAPAQFTAQDMTALRAVSLDLEFIDGVTAVGSPFLLRWPPTKSAPSGAPLFGAEIKDGFADDLAKFERLGTNLPTFLNSSLSGMLISIAMDTDKTTLTDAVASISAELDRGLPVAVTATLTGEDVISVEIVSGLKADLIALNLWGAAITSLAAIALLRDVRMAFLAVGPAVVGAAGVLALSVWLGYPITVLSNVIPILLLVLGVADGLHLAGHLKANHTPREVVETVGPACALTALTTAVAFASIMLTGNAQLFEFAVLGVLGTMLSFAIVIVTFVLLAGFIVPTARPIPQISAAIAQQLTNFGAAKPRVTIALCLLLLVISTVSFAQTKAWFPLYQNLPDNSPTLANNDAIAKDFGGAFQMIVETKADWPQTRALAARLQHLAGPHAVLSAVGFARWLGHPDRRPSQAELDTLPQALAAQMQANGATRMFVSVPEPMRNQASLDQFDALYAAAVDGGADKIFGLPTIMRKEAVDLIDQLSLGLVAAAAGATGLVALAFRSVRLIPVLIVPNILPLMLTGASLHIWAQGQLTPTAVLALTLAFGIAIDDTVHFLSRFSDAQKRGKSAVQAVQFATRSAGQMMLLTTALLVAGLCVTLASDFNPIRLFGGMMIVTLLAALLTDLLLLPALLTWKRTPHAPL